MSDNKRSKNIWARALRWYVLAAAWGLAWTLSFIGLGRFAAARGEVWTWMDKLYRTLQLVVLESGSVEGQLDITLEVARFMLPALTGLTALQALSVFFNQQLRWLRLLFIKDHLVVAGVNQKSHCLLKDARANDLDCVVIDENIEAGQAIALRALGVDLIEGDPKDPQTLREAKIQRSAYFVSFLGDDAENLRAALACGKASAGVGPRRVIELRSTDLVDLIKGSSLRQVSHSAERLEPYNEFTRAANNLIDHDDAWQKPSLPARVEVYGVGVLGAHLAEKILYTWRAADVTSKPTLRVYDHQASKALDRIRELHPEVDEFCAVTALDIDLTSRDAIRGSNGTIEEVYLCLPDPILNLRVALTLAGHANYAGACFHIRMRQDDAELAEMLVNSLPKQTEARFIPFDPSAGTLTVEMVLGGVTEALARGLYFAYCKASGADLDRAAWDELGTAEKRSNRQLAARVIGMIEERGYSVLPMRDWSASEFQLTEGEIEAMAEAEHNAWKTQKQAAGWRFGETTDPKKKIHADLVGWRDLPQSERIKNQQFFIDLPKLLADLGYALELNA